MAPGQDVMTPQRDKHSYFVQRAAIRHGITTDVHPGDMVEGGDPAVRCLRLHVGDDFFFHYKQTILHQPAGTDRPTLINSACVSLLENKQALKGHLERAGISVPTGRVFRRPERRQAFLYAAEQDGELCVKPNLGQNGDLVFPGLRTAAQITEAIDAVLYNFDEVLIEQNLTGQAWRLMYVEPEIIAARVNRPASVVGDGRNSLAALIETRSRERDRRDLTGHYPTRDGHAIDFMLARQQLTRDSVPAAGRRVFLHPASNMRMGADAISCADTLHPDYRAEMRKACQSIAGLRTATLDVLIRDPAAPLRPDGHGLLELNSNPGLSAFHQPWEGPPQDAAGALVRLMMGLAGLAVPAA